MARSYIKILLTSLLFLAACAATFAMRWPLVTSNDRYLRDEEDSRQFNRAVEMAQEGDLNPRYFNKPSLNFYLRVPVVFASYIFAKSRGEIQDLNEIKTRDPYGLSGWSYVASHPTILRWNRVFSVLLSVGVVALAFIIATQLGQGPWYALLAAAITAISPEVVKNSHIIGVDVLMAFLCLACTSVGMRCVEKTSRSSLIVCGLLAGLAGAAKYNALPIVTVPFSVWALKERTRWGLFLTFVSPGVGFFLGCPYSLLSFQEFGTAVAYEAWHYSVAGHEGHSAQPGLEQAIFYFGWLIVEGVGIAAGGLALASSIYFIKKRNFQIAIFLAFPISYSLLMIFQKTNFTKNMVVMVPYVAVMAVCGLSRLVKVAEHETVKRGAPPTFASLVLLQLAVPCVLFIRSQNRIDSREIAHAWLTQERQPDQDVAVSGPLQLSPAVVKGPGIDVFAPTDKTSASLLQEGYDFIVMSPLSTVASDRPLFSIAKEIPGILYQQKIPDSPAIRVYRLNTDRLDIASKRAPSSLVLSAPDSNSAPTCATEGENFCWLTARFTSVTLQNSEPTPRQVKLPVMSPWSNQEIVIATPKGTELYRDVITSPATWSDISFKLPGNVETVSITLTQVHSYASRRQGEDKRRLGLAVKAPTFEAMPPPDPEQPSVSIISGYPELIRLAILDTLTQEIEAPIDSAAPQAPEMVAAPQAPEAGGTIYSLLQTLDDGSEGAVPAEESAGAGASAAQVLDIPSVEQVNNVVQQQEEFRQKFLETILAATGGEEPQE